MVIKVKDRRAFLTSILQFLSSLLPHKLNPQEIVVFTEFLLLPEEYKHRRYSKEARKRIARVLYPSSNKAIAALNNHIQALVHKKYLLRDEDGVTYTSKALLQLIEQFDSNSRLTIPLE